MLSPTLFSIFLERIVTDENHEDSVSIRGRIITSLRLAGDIDSLAEKEEEQAKLVVRVDKASTASTDKASKASTKPPQPATKPPKPRQSLHSLRQSLQGLAKGSTACD